MRVLITGANGMLATNLVEGLLAKGYLVRGLLRSIASYRGDEHPSLELIEGDFSCYDTAQMAIEGCDYIIHSAAITAQNLLSYDQYKRVNVDATVQLLDLAVSHHIKRFVYVSTANTIGYGSPSDPSDEEATIMSPYCDSMYVRSKLEAEEAVLAVSDRLDVVITNPTFMLGKYGDPRGSNRIFNMARKVTICPRGGRNFIDVEEASEGVIGAMLMGRRGERYLICGENLSYRAFFERLDGVKYILHTPNWALRAIGRVGELLRWCGVETDMSRVNMEMLCQSLGYSGAKARRELNFVPRAIAPSRYL